MAGKPARKDKMNRFFILSMAALAFVTASNARAARTARVEECVICTLFYDPVHNIRYWGCPPAASGALSCIIGTGGSSCLNVGFCP